MNFSVQRFQQWAMGLLAMTLFSGVAARAGTPLMCHPIAIGPAQSLPWASNDWHLSGTEAYNVKNLVGDTLAILNPTTPVLVRMETMRRATLYAQKDSRVAKELLAKLQARASVAENAATPDALAFFDAGYLIETYRHGLGKTQNPADGMDGYVLVKKAISLRGQDPQMEFAATLITLYPQRSEYREHLLRATAGAKQDPLLAQNLASRFSDDPTIAAMFAKTVSTKQ
jgi:hypothetical protein